MKLSLIIPVYNTGIYLNKCLSSCLDQDIPFSDFEIIIINDGSSDNSLEIIELFCVKYSNVKFVSQSNQGLSAARNKGVSLAKGDYIWFIDSDDWIKDNCLSEIIQRLYLDDLDGLLISAANLYGKDVIRRYDRSDFERQIFTGKDIVYHGILEVCAPFTIYKREYLYCNNLKFMEGIFHEDTEFTPRAYYKLKKVSIYNDIVYYVYQNPNSITRTVNPKKSFDLLIVANSLSFFSLDIDAKYACFVKRQIITCINKALLGASFMDIDQKKKFRTQIRKNKFLFKYFIQSNSFVFVIEGILCYLFSYRSDCIYHFFYRFFYPKNN